MCIPHFIAGPSPSLSSSASPSPSPTTSPSGCMPCPCQWTSSRPHYVSITRHFPPTPSPLCCLSEAIQIRLSSRLATRIASSFVGHGASRIPQRTWAWLGQYAAKWHGDLLQLHPHPYLHLLRPPHRQPLPQQHVCHAHLGQEIIGKFSGSKDVCLRFARCGLLRVLTNCLKHVSTEIIGPHFFPPALLLWHQSK